VRWRREAWWVGISVVLMLWLGFGVFRVEADGLSRALGAVGCVAAAWVCAQGQPGRSAIPWRVPGREALAPAVVIAAGAVGIVWTRASRSLTGLEDKLVRVGDMPWWFYWTDDAGLPSLLHHGINYAATWVGGVGLVMAVHVALYAAVMWRLFLLGRRFGGGPLGLALMVFWGTAPGALGMFVDMRGYPTFLFCLLMAESAMVTGEGQDEPSDAAVLRWLSLACLEIPSALSTLGVYTAVRMAQGKAQPWFVAGALCVAAGILPLGWGAHAVHAGSGDGGLTLTPGLALAVGLMGLGLLRAFWEGFQRPAVAASLGSLGLVLGLMLSGVLDVEARYFYQSGVLPLVLLTGWGMGKLRAWSGEQGMLFLVVVLLSGPFLMAEAQEWPVSASLTGSTFGLAAGAVVVLSSLLPRYSGWGAGALCALVLWLHGEVVYRRAAAEQAYQRVLVQAVVQAEQDPGGLCADAGLYRELNLRHAFDGVGGLFGALHLPHAIDEGLQLNGNACDEASHRVAFGEVPRTCGVLEQGGDLWLARCASGVSQTAR